MSINDEIVSEEKPAPIVYGDESLSDVTLVVGNQKFVAHKMVLAIRSDVFKTMFFGSFKESKKAEIEIKDVSVDNFRRLIELLYTGKISDADKFLEFPLHGSEHFDIELKRGKPSNGPHTHFTPSYEQFFNEFWQKSTDLFIIADRFNVTPAAKEYIGTNLATAIRDCSKGDCHVCLNSFIRLITSGIDVSSCQKQYSKSLYMEWLGYATEEPYPESISVKGLMAMFKQLYEEEEVTQEPPANNVVQNGNIYTFGW